MAARFTVDEAVSRIMQDSDSGSELEMSDNVRFYFFVCLCNLDVVFIIFKQRSPGKLYFLTCNLPVGSDSCVQLGFCFCFNTLIHICNFRLSITIG